MATRAALTISSGTISEIPAADTLLAGVGIDAEAAGAFTVGGSTATSVVIGQSGVSTTVANNLTVSGTTTTIRSVPYVWPSSQGAASTVLTNDGSGNLSWAAGGGGGGMAIGGTVTGGTTGSVLFIGAASALAQDNANLFWDDTNNRLGVKTASPVDAFEVAGAVHASGTASNSKASETFIDFVAGVTNRGRLVALGPDTSTNANIQIYSARSNGLSALEAFFMNTSGAIGLGTVTPSGGAGDVDIAGALKAGAAQFQVGSDGDLDKIKNVTYSWPGSQGAASTVLTNDGSGNLSWAAGGGGMAIGGTVTGGTTGSVLFVGSASALAQDNANLFWDDTNNRLGVKTASPVDAFEVAGAVHASGTASNSKASETFIDFVAGVTNRGRLVALGPDTSTNANIQIYSARSNGLSALEAFFMNTSGAIGLGTVTPSGGAGDVDVAGALKAGAAQFQVGSDGDLDKIKNVTYSWPGSQGAASTVLTNDGSGNLSWAAGGGGGSPAGTTGAIQFNNAGAFGANTNNLFWDDSNNRLGIGTTTPADRLTVVTANQTYGITHSNGTVKVSTYTDTAAGLGYIGTQSNHKLGFYAGTSGPAGALTTAGNWGFGNTAPTQKVDITGTAVVSDSLGVGNTAPEEIVTATSTGNAAYGFLHVHSTVKIGTFINAITGVGNIGTKSNHSLGFFTNNAVTSSVMDTSGNWGIGRTTASAQLDVDNGSVSESIFIARKDGTAVFTIGDNGTLVVKNTSNSATAYQMQNAAGTVLFNVDTTQQRVSVGTTGSTHTFNVGTGASANFCVASGGRIHTYDGSAPTDGQILIGDTALGNFAKATITAGSGISVTNGAGTVTIASSIPSSDLSLITTGLTAGDVCYVASNNTAAAANATAIGTANVIGVVKTVGGAGIGTVAGGGIYVGANFITGLTLSAGQTAYLSKTDGKLTNDVSAFTTGNVWVPIGVITNVTTAGGGTGAADVAVDVDLLIVV